MRLVVRDSATTFEQAIGYGFSELTPLEAANRFGAFPLWIFVYNALATIGNVLFAEPVRGVFRITQAFAELRPQSSQLLQIGSSTALTLLIAWWGVGSWRAVPSRLWSPDARLFVATGATVLACGALSFDYSRDRLGGMAVPFYALSAFHALRAAARRLCALPRPQYLVGALALTLLVAAWGTRMVTTLEYARHTAWINQQQWLVLLADRRIEFADRPTYLQIMESMVEQGTTAAPVSATAYPPWVGRAIGQPF
jgi:hypothetical protein